LSKRTSCSLAIPAMDNRIAEDFSN